MRNIITTVTLTIISISVMASNSVQSIKKDPNILNISNHIIASDFIEKENNETIIEYDYVWDFVDGFALVKKNDKYGYINSNQQQITQLEYDFAWSFSEGLALVQKNNERFYINRQGKIQ